MHVNEMSMKMKLGFGKLVLGSFRMLCGIRRLSFY